MEKLKVKLYLQKKAMIDEYFNYIYVLDFCDSEIYEIKIDDSDRNKEIEDIIEERGCNINTCSWMVTSDKMKYIISL